MNKHRYIITAMTAPFIVAFDAKHGLQLDAYLPSTSDRVNGRPLSDPVGIHYHRGGMLIGPKNDIYPPFMPGECIISLIQSCRKLINISSISSISENRTHLPQLPIIFPVVCR